MFLPTVPLQDMAEAWEEKIGDADCKMRQRYFYGISTAQHSTAQHDIEKSNDFP